MATVIRKVAVGGAEVSGQRRLGSFLPEACVQHAWHVPLLELCLETFLEGSDEPHVLVELDHCCCVHRMRFLQRLLARLTHGMFGHRNLWLAPLKHEGMDERLWC